MLNCRPASPTELSKAKVISQHADYYSILGIKLRFRSDDQEIRDHIRHIYRWFLLSNPEPVDYDFFFFTENGQAPLLLMNKQAYSFKKTDFLPNQVNNILVSALTDNLREHFLFHGAAVYRKDRGILIVGQSGSGKTSLALKFVHEGYEFLSDEFVPIHRRHLKLYPFPCSLGLRRGTLELFPHLKNKPLRHNLNEAEGEKWFLDSACFSPRKKPCYFKTIYFLDPNRRKGDHLLDVGIYKKDSGFAQIFNTIPKVSIERQCDVNGYSVCLVRVKREARCLPDFLHACRPFGEVILYRDEMSEEEHDFSRESNFIPLDKPTAAMELLKHLRNRTRGSLLRREFPNHSRLLMEMARIVEGVECWRVDNDRI